MRYCCVLWTPPIPAGWFADIPIRLRHDVAEWAVRKKLEVNNGGQRAQQSEGDEKSQQRAHGDAAAEFEPLRMLE